MKNHLKISVFVFVLIVSNFARADFLQVGDLYSSNYFSNTIKHYTPSGQFLDSYTLSSSYGQETKGMAFGVDGLLYTVNTSSSGYNVTTIDNAGTATIIANGTDYIHGNLSYGKIAISNSGAYYVAGQNHLTAFNLGSSSGSVIYTANQVFDVEVLPNGNLLVLSAYDLREITPTGAIVRDINTSISLGDARGLEYDSVTNSIYVTMLGYTGQGFRLMKIDADTGNVELNSSFVYGDDMFLTDDNRLIVGSRTQAPGIFDTDLNSLGVLGGGQSMFVTQMVSSVPIPSAIWLLGTSLLGFISVRYRRN